MEKNVIDLMAEYSVCPHCGDIFIESDLEQVDGIAKCSNCGKKLVLQHVNMLHEIFSAFLDDHPTIGHSLTEKTIETMKQWFREEFYSKESCHYDIAQKFVDTVWKCMCHNFME